MALQQIFGLFCWIALVWFGLVLRFGRQFCGKYIKHLSHLAICMPGQLCNIFLHICGSLCHCVCICLCVCVHCFLGQASSVGWAAIWEIPSWAAFLLPVTCYHLSFTCCPDTIKLQSQLCVLLPITLQLLLLLPSLLSLLSQLISRAQSQLEVKAKKHSNNTLDNANANVPNDTVIVGHCFYPIIGNTLQKKVPLAKAGNWHRDSCLLIINTYT